MKLLRGLLALAYPFLVFGALLRVEPRALAACLALVLALRALLLGREAAPLLRRLLAPAAVATAVLAGAAVSNDERFLLLVPALVNGALLFAFARTLFGGPTLVETIARTRVPDLPEEEVRYCRSVTLVWCAFFVANGGVASWLALSGDLVRWTLYTGLVSYLLVGLLFAVEFVVRSWRFGRYEGSLVEPLFRRIFPRGSAP